MSETTSTKTYDNSGGLWPERRAWSGTATIDGEKYQAVCVGTGAEAKNLPSHRLHLYKGDTVYSAALWRPKEEKKYAASGHVHIGPREWLIFIFKNDSTHPKAPTLRLSFLVKGEDGQRESAPAAASHPPVNSEVPANDEVPF